MSVLRTLVGAVQVLMGKEPVPVRVRVVPPRQRQKRHFKACRRRAGRHHRMPPARYGARIHVEWEPFDPSRLMVMVAGMAQEVRK